jgi:hypothetical protein
VIHQLGATSSGVLSSYLCGRNFMWLLARDVPIQGWRANWPRMVLAQTRIALDAVRHSREPAARARLRGQLAGLRAAAWLWHERQELSRRRTVAEAELVAMFAP